MKTLNLLIFLLLPFLGYAQPSRTYEKQWPFSEGLARVMKMVNFNGYMIPMYGFIDSSGEEIIPVQFDYAEDFCNGIALVGRLRKAERSENRFTLCLAPRFNYITKTGKELKYEFYNATSSNIHTKSVLVGSPFKPYHNEPAMGRHEYKYQYVEIPVSKIVECVNNLTDLNIPRAWAHWAKAKDNQNNYNTTYKINLKNTAIAPSEDVATYYISQKEPSMISDDRKGEVIIDTIMQKYIVIVQHGLCGIRSYQTDKLLIPCMYNDIIYLGKGIFAVHKCKSYALINDNREYITEFIYDKISTMRTPDSDEFSGIAYMIRDRYQYGGWAHRYIYDQYNLDRDGSGYQPRKYKGYIK